MRSPSTRGPGTPYRGPATPYTRRRTPSDASESSVDDEDEEDESDGSEERARLALSADVPRARLPLSADAPHDCAHRRPTGHPKFENGRRPSAKLQAQNVTKRRVTLSTKPETFEEPPRRQPESNHGWFCA